MQTCSAVELRSTVCFHTIKSAQASAQRLRMFYLGKNNFNGTMWLSKLKKPYNMACYILAFGHNAEIHVTF